MVERNDLVISIYNYMAYAMQPVADSRGGGGFPLTYYYLKRL